MSTFTMRLAGDCGGAACLVAHGQGAGGAHGEGPLSACARLKAGPAHAGPDLAGFDGEGTYFHNLGCFRDTGETENVAEGDA